jgi:hypothetical protein
LRPVIWEVTARMWTGWAFNCQATRRRSFDSFRIVASPSTLEDHKIPPDPKDPVKFLVSKLEWKD